MIWGEDTPMTEKTHMTEGEDVHNLDEAGKEHVIWEKGEVGEAIHDLGEGVKEAKSVCA